MIEIWLIALTVCVAFLASTSDKVHRRVRKIEKREWPSRVVEWRTLPDTRCRCTTKVDRSDV